MILGLDISTSCTGLTILDSAGLLVDLLYVDTRKDKSLFCKAKRIKNELLKIRDKYDIEHVFVEENLQGFSTGMSSAMTLLQLARINGITSFACFEIFDIEPTFLNVNATRKACGIKVNRKLQAKTKEQVFWWVKEQLPDYQWPTKILKSGPNKGNVKLMEYCYDMSDSYVIAHGGYIQYVRDSIDNTDRETS